MQVIGLLSVALFPSLLTVILCAVGCALGYGMLSTCCNAIVCRSVSLERRSYAVSTFWMFSDGGMGLGPFIMGAFASLGGYSTMLVTAAVVTFVGLPVYYYFWGRTGGKSREAAAIAYEEQAAKQAAGK